ncbi:MAG: hypothetical protein Q9210_004354 [Variospora velana]
MSGYPSDPSKQGSNPPDTNYFYGFASLMSPATPNVSQPAFGQSWSGPTAWDSPPLMNYDLSSSFPSASMPNQGFNSNQQNDSLVYSEDDDFYDNIERQPAQTSNMTVDSNERSTNSLATQAKDMISPKSAIMTSQPTTTGPSVPSRSNALSGPTSESTNPTLSSKQVSNDRAKALRAKLLASKARSTTPLPPTPSKSDGTASNGNVIKALVSTTVESSTQEPKNGGISVRASAGEKVASKPDDKSSPYSPRVPTLPPANADIQGLIDEYRSGEAGHGLKSPLKASTKEIPPQYLSDAKRIGGASESSNTVVVPQSIITNGSSQSKNGSPRSFESGEIRSDQESGAVTSVHDTSPNSAPPNTIVWDGPHATNGAPGPGKKPTLEPRPGPTDALKSKALSSTPKHDGRTEGQDRRKSLRTAPEPLHVPLAQRTENLRMTEDQSLLQQKRAGSDSRRHVDDRKNDCVPRKANLPSTLARNGRPETSNIIGIEEARRNSGSQHKANENRASGTKQQASGHRRSSSDLNNAPEVNDTSSKEVHDIPNPDVAAIATGLNTQVLQPRKEARSRSPVSGGQAVSLLSLSQQEQIRGLGIDLTPGGLKDLYDFLVYHRFFVKEYREGFMNRQRRLRALEEEKLAVERESLAQYELFNSMRAQSLAAREHSEPYSLPVLQSKKEVEGTPSRKPMPPPLTVPRKSDVGSAIAVHGQMDPNEITPTMGAASRANEQLTTRDVLDRSNLKRQHLGDDVDLDHGKKYTCVESDTHWNRSQPVSPEFVRPKPQALDRRHPSDFRAAEHGHRGRSRSPDHRRRSPSPYRRGSGHYTSPRYKSWTASQDRGQDRPFLGHEESRRDPRGTLCRHCDRTGHYTTDCPDQRRNSGGRYLGSERADDNDGDGGKPQRSSQGNLPLPKTNIGGRSRGGRAGFYTKSFHYGSTPYSSSPTRQVAVATRGSEALDLQAGDSRYFMIKSWNAENVEASQRDNTWATQPKNLDTFTEAFNSCRNVILVFSVNNSRAFQGYARMQTLPSPRIPAPEWQKELHWASTDPFRIEWITIAPTRFQNVGHLKNALNERQAVLVGRDGQEIEEGCGRALCELIDETAMEQERYEHDY